MEYDCVPSRGRSENDCIPSRFPSRGRFEYELAPPRLENEPISSRLGNELPPSEGRRLENDLSPPSVDHGGFGSVLFWRMSVWRSPEETSVSRGSACLCMTQNQTRPKDLEEEEEGIGEPWTPVGVTVGYARFRSTTQKVGASRAPITSDPDLWVDH